MVRSDFEGLVISAISFPVKHIPVSYTHLDVYKRQATDNAAPGMVANPINSKYSILFALMMAGSFIFGAGI